MYQNLSKSNPQSRFIRVPVAVAGVLVVAAGLTIAITALSDRSWRPLALAAAQPAKQSGQPEESDIAIASKQSFDVTTTATGELEARRQIDVRNQLEQPTTIIEIIKEGAQVKAGDVLVRLNSDSIQTQVDEDSLRVQTARADSVASENNFVIQENQNASDLRKALLDIEISELEYRKWLEGEVKSRQQANQLAFEKATREQTRLKEKYERSAELERRGFLARDELQRDELTYLEAQAALKTAELNTKVYDEFEFVKDQKVKSSTVDQAKAELEKVTRRNQGELAKATADRNNKREQLRLREAKLDKLKEQLEYCTLKAPSDGLVVYATSLNRDRWGNNGDGVLDVGRQVTRNQQIIVLPDTSEMVASVRVHESLTGRMRVGQAATIKVDALGGKSITGRVDSIGVIAESGGWRDPNLREYTIKIALDTAGIEAELKPSMRAEAQIFLDKVDNALTVPIQAIFSDGLVRYVLVPEGKRFVKRPVRVGRRSERFAETTAGIAEGERILLRDAEPGEILDKPWDKAALAAVGLALQADGRVLAVGGRPTGMPGNAKPPQSGSGQPNPSMPGPARPSATQPAPTATPSTTPSTPTAAKPESRPAAKPGPG